MALFKCENCGCAENTALSGQGFQRVRLYDWSYAPELKGKMLCSECGPRNFKDGKPTPYGGKWHGVFKKERYNASCLDPEVLNKLRSACIINLAKSGARVAIVVSDDPRYLKKKFRTWVKLYPNDLNRDIKAGSNSKFVFVVKNLNQLPLIAKYQACLILSVEKSVGKVVVLKSRTSGQLVFRTTENLEHYLNKNASRDLANDYDFEVPEALPQVFKHYITFNDCQ